uniref:Uncharacterized protein n=1 Tax=Phlebotomus papatasi TaxID=29031 RepID=A0A1B0DIH3_PHLPP
MVGSILGEAETATDACSKRTVDFGLARGFSGIQEAKHRMGLAAANYAGGPGRKRRSDSTPVAPPDSEA